MPVYISLFSFATRKNNDRKMHNVLRSAKSGKVFGGLGQPRHLLVCLHSPLLNAMGGNELLMHIFHS